MEDHNLVIKLSSPLQIDILDQHRTDLLQHLRTKLKNYKIKLSAHLVQDDSKKMIYTPQEKFDHLAEKHPLLRDLKDRLGLDPDL